MSNEFTAEQKRYLEGFLSGAQAMRAGKGASAPVVVAGNQGPDKPHLDAQDEVTDKGGKLADQEKWKRAEHPFDAYGRFRTQAKSGAYPKPEDNFRWRYHGVFYVAPAQDSYMCRMRIPGGIMKHWQLRVVADMAKIHGGGYAHVTTRANLQIREIKAQSAPDVLEGLAEAGIVSKGSGADNIRNVTGSATAGIDAQELLDTRPHASLFPRRYRVPSDCGTLRRATECFGFARAGARLWSSSRKSASLRRSAWSERPPASPFVSPNTFYSARSPLNMLHPN